VIDGPVLRKLSLHLIMKGCDGVMSATALLANPALFYPSLQPGYGSSIVCSSVTRSASDADAPQSAAHDTKGCPCGQERCLGKEAGNLFEQSFH
jgi:hypothetical protein